MIIKIKVNQLTADINFISSKPGSDETRTMYTKSINAEIMTGGDTNEVIEVLFESLLQKYQTNVEEKMRGSEFAFDGVNALYYDLNKISLNRGGSYIKSPEWLSAKKATINRQNKKDDKCFQYALTVVNHGDFHCLNCFHAYTTENKLESHKKVCENHDYCL